MASKYRDRKYPKGFLEQYPGSKYPYIQVQLIYHQTQSKAIIVSEMSKNERETSIIFVSANVSNATEVYVLSLQGHSTLQCHKILWD